MKNTLYICACAPVSDGGGLYRFSLDGGKLAQEAYLPLDRPMYAMRRGDKLHILLREIADGEGGYVCTPLSLDGVSAPVSTKGAVPCHIAVTDDDVYYVNYISGSVASLSGKMATRRGRGVHPKRQDAPHTHFVTELSTGSLAVCDLGTDALVLYDKALRETGEAHVPAGYGIRHIIEDVPRGLIYAVCELVPAICTFQLCGDSISLLSTVDLPCEREGSLSAAIRLDRDTIYASVRGEDAVFVLSAGDTPRITGKISSFGAWPRDFDVVDGYLVCTNEIGNCVTVVTKDGELTDKVPLPSPICVTK